MRNPIFAGTDVRFVRDFYHDCGVCGGMKVAAGTTAKVTRMVHFFDDFVPVDAQGVTLCEGMRIDRDDIEVIEKEATK